MVVGSPISIYYIFYGNFTDLEVSRIENYATHISDPSTKPDRTNITTTFEVDNASTSDASQIIVPTILGMVLRSL
ncbi:hypothetical protein HDU76_007795 [Blyttiomyces sp. JEL0837]|nr:hypothetical protein HDU76_007795 [Blyttiomyces sp. JEL0837]